MAARNAAIPSVSPGLTGSPAQKRGAAGNAAAACARPPPGPLFAPTGGRGSACRRDRPAAAPEQLLAGRVVTAAVRRPSVATGCAAPTRMGRPSAAMGRNYAIPRSIRVHPRRRGTAPGVTDRRGAGPERLGDHLSRVWEDDAVPRTVLSRHGIISRRIEKGSTRVPRFSARVHAIVTLPSCA